MLVVELDDRGDHYGGSAFAYNNDRSAPALIGAVKFNKGETKFSLKVPLNALGRGSGLYYTEDDCKKRYPNLAVSSVAESEWEVTPENINIKWKTDIGTNGQAVLSASEGYKPTKLVAASEVTNWQSYKQFVVKNLLNYPCLYRGQEQNDWRLRTSFHRTNRSDLLWFMQNDLGNLLRNLSGLTTHRFVLENNLDYASFMSLVQHHGYPTPILDWTRSPFIAAYFAYNNLTKKEVQSDQKVRIHLFDAPLCNTSFERAGVIAPGFLHLTVLEPMPTDNPRAIPQQAYSTVTNVDDLETYIHQREVVNNSRYLVAFDLPANERNLVMRELDLMVINAGSLFPGLEGVCQVVKERNFLV